MLTLLLIYVIGRAFYKLGDKFGKPKWGLVFAGIAIYYAGIIICVFLQKYFIGFEFENLTFKDRIFYGLMAVPAGAFAAEILFQILHARWSKSV